MLWSGDRQRQRDSVPVTAKLSRKVYDALGDEVANELVDWFNQVDLTYRTELRELNELNFARFDARLDQRLANLRGEMQGDLADLEVRTERRFAELRAELLKWMFLFWLGTIGPILALLWPMG
jgi:hypothetical protein